MWGHELFTTLSQTHLFLEEKVKTVQGKEHFDQVTSKSHPSGRGSGCGAPISVWHYSQAGATWERAGHTFLTLLVGLLCHPRMEEAAIRANWA